MRAISLPLLIGLLSLAACRRPAESALPTREAAPPAATPTPTATSTATTAPRPLPTTTPTLMPTPTPLPTLTNEQEIAVQDELMELDVSCPLPCWWGIVPNESRLDPVLVRLRELGFRVWPSAAGMRPAGGFLTYLDFSSSEGVVTAIDVGGDYMTGEGESLAAGQAFARGWRDYSMAALIGRYGMPSRAFLYSPFRPDPGGGPSYSLLLFYEHLGIVAEYHGFAEELQNSWYRACVDLTSIFSIELFLYQPGTLDAIVETILPADSLSYLGEPDVVHGLVEWQQATGISLEEFYAVLQSAENAPCIEYSTP